MSQRFSTVQRQLPTTRLMTICSSAVAVRNKEVFYGGRSATAKQVPSLVIRPVWKCPWETRTGIIEQPLTFIATQRNCILIRMFGLLDILLEVRLAVSLAWPLVYRWSLLKLYPMPSRLLGWVSLFLLDPCWAHLRPGNTPEHITLGTLPILYTWYIVMRLLHRYPTLK